MVASQSGMGAIPFLGGVSFRVWAPNVEGVFVTGEFNSWSDSANPLSSENNGFWSGDVTSAQILQEYKFIIQENGTKTWKNDPYARDVTNSVGNSIIVDRDFNWSSDVFSMPSWNELIIYEMHVGTFNDDGTPPLGNFASVLARLPDLQSLGINAINIMPCYEFPGDLSWGYNPAHPFAIESAFGTPENFKRFVQAAHDSGIAVLLDVVYNHFGRDDLDLWRFTSWNQNNLGGIYFYNDRRHQTPWGPRPDYGRGEVRQYIRDNALMWLDECRVDGLRVDATAFIRNIYGNNNDPGNDIPEGWSLMRWINDEIDSHFPWKIVIAEDIRGNEWITRSTASGGAGFDSQWAKEEFFRPIRNSVVTPNDQDRNIFSVRDAIYHRYSSNAFERVIYTESHDEVSASLNLDERPDYYRVPEEIWRGNADSWFSRKRSTLGAALVFTSPGIPMIFQGQEFLAWGSWKEDAPLDWRQKDQYSGIWDLYQSLIRLRRNWFNNTRGLRGQNVNVYHVNNADKALAFHRWESGGTGDDVIVVANFADRSYDSYTVGFPREGTWYVRFNSDWSGYSSDFGNFGGYDTTAGRAIWGDTDGMPFAGNIGVGPYSVLILYQ